MKSLKTIYITGIVAITIIAGTFVGYSKDKNGNSNKNNQTNRRNGNQNGGQNGSQQTNPSRNGSGRNGDNSSGQNNSDQQRGDKQSGNPAFDPGSKSGGGRSQGNSDSDRNSQSPALTKHQTSNGYDETAPSGKVRVHDEKKDDGEHVTKFSATGSKQVEEVRRNDGTKQVSRFDASGRVKQEEVVHTDGSREVSNRQVGRDGNVRVKETVKYDVHEKIVTKTVERRVNKVVIVNHYDRCRYGYVYHPVFVMAPVVAWYDPYWYTPAGVVVVHPFHYSWGWESHGWYHSYYGPYWTAYDVYPTPSYWVTDWMVADYMQDRYEAQVSVAQAQAEAQAARDEAAKAQAAAQAAQDQAEIAEAKAAQAQAELRAKNAEAKLAAAQRQQDLAGKPNPNATPIDKDTKEALKSQIDQTILEKKTLAEQAQKGQEPTLPDVSKALADPKHIYPVSKVVSVTSAKDSSPAGTLSEGDLLKLEPGQEDKLKSLGENDLITMRVMTSKGDDGEVTAGTLVNISVHDLQDFDNEFRAKVDAGMDEASKHQDDFKQGASNS